jgi:hypothetical protein
MPFWILDRPEAMQGKMETAVSPIFLIFLRTHIIMQKMKKWYLLNHSEIRLVTEGLLLSSSKYSSSMSPTDTSSACPFSHMDWHHSDLKTLQLCTPFASPEMHSIKIGISGQHKSVWATSWSNWLRIRKD